MDCYDLQGEGHVMGGSRASMTASELIDKHFNRPDDTFQQEVIIRNYILDFVSRADEGDRTQRCLIHIIIM